MIPSADAESERYRGRPLLIILESYVLAAISALDSNADGRLAKWRSESMAVKTIGARPCVVCLSSASRSMNPRS